MGYMLVDENLIKALFDSLNMTKKTLRKLADNFQKVASGIDQVLDTWNEMYGSENNALYNMDRTIIIDPFDLDNQEPAHEMNHIQEEANELDYNYYEPTDCDSCPHACGDSLDECAGCGSRTMHPSGIWDNEEY